MKQKSGEKPILVNSNNIAVQSNRFIEARYKESLTFWESFLITKMCSMISPDDVDFKPYKIYIKEVVDYMELTPSGHVYTYIMDAANRLLDRKIVIGAVDEEGRKEIIETHIVTSVRRLLEPKQDDNMYVTLTFLPELKPFLLQLHRDFTKLDMDIFKKLKTSSSIRLYQIFKSHMGKNQYKVRFELEELKEILGVSEKYQQYAGFKMRVLDEAQQRLTEKTDIGFTYEELKTGKKVSALVFHTFHNKQRDVPQLEADILSDLPKSDEEQENLILELTPLVVKKFGVSLKVFMGLVEKHTEGEVRKAVQITEKTIQVGKIENIAGFFVEALRGAYQEAGEKKKKLDAKNTEKKAQKEVEIALGSQKQKESKSLFERNKAIFKRLIEEDGTFWTELEQAIKSDKMIKTSYDYERNVFENMKKPMIEGAIMSIALKLRSEEFNQ
jgi:plasmid replication initiation protein